MDWPSERRKGILVGTVLYIVFAVAFSAMTIVLNRSEGGQVLPTAVHLWGVIGSVIPFLTAGMYLRCRGRFGEDESRKDRRDLAVSLACYLAWILAVAALAPRLPSWVGDCSLLSFAGFLITLAALLAVGRGRRTYRGPPVLGT